jgi:hypothetical protein
MIMNGVPNITPRSRPDTRIPFVNLNKAVLSEAIFNLKDKGPKRRSHRTWFGHPKGCVRVILSFKNGAEKLILFSSYVPSRVHD